MFCAVPTIKIFKYGFAFRIFMRFFEPFEFGCMQSMSSIPIISGLFWCAKAYSFTLFINAFMRALELISKDDNAISGAWAW